MDSSCQEPKIWRIGITVQSFTKVVARVLVTLLQEHPRQFQYPCLSSISMSYFIFKEHLGRAYVGPLGAQNSPVLLILKPSIKEDSDWAASSGVTADDLSLSLFFSLSSSLLPFRNEHETFSCGSPTSSGVPVLIKSNTLRHFRSHKARMHEGNCYAFWLEVEAQ